MTDTRLFTERPDVLPQIYAYELLGVKSHEGYIKIGYTVRDVNTRIKEQLHTAGLSGEYRLLGTWPAMKNDGSCFSDTDVRNFLKKNGHKQLNSEDDRNEWIECTADDVAAAVMALKKGIENPENRTQDFKMRPEQRAAVDAIKNYYTSFEKENPGKPSRFLLNAKMRFGKSFTTYELCKEMNFTRILILTFKPAALSSWREDLLSHIDFEGWQLITPSSSSLSIGEQYEKADKSRPIVCFCSLQYILRNDKPENLKPENEWINTVPWDIAVFDEYHYGAWRENTKSLFESDSEEKVFSFDAEEYKEKEADDAYDESWLPITADHYLYLSGTPFRALSSGEFTEEQVSNWTYSDEQRAKESWTGPDNPYKYLPRMIMMAYQTPESIQEIAKNSEYNEFDLNVFFSAEGTGDDAHFIYEEYVQKFLDLIRGAYLETTVDELKLGADKPPMPFSDTRLLNVLSHTLWFLPSVSSCYAMANLLKQKQNVFYHDYKVIVCAGKSVGSGDAALIPVRAAMDDPLETKTITLSCGKLMSGVTVRPWTGIFMLCNMSSPETYFQAAFRVQSSWTARKDNGEVVDLKPSCYVFDFAPNRALRQIYDYSCQLSAGKDSPEKAVEEFINFLPVLAYEGSAMREINASEILDIMMSGTTAALLARRWQSALLVNVDNRTLEKLFANEEAMSALMGIEEFRNLNTDIETIINKSESVKKVKKESPALSDEKKKEVSEDEREYRLKRKEIQRKLIKFATRIPIFMYLTDHREMSLKDVITDVEPELFEKVTGLTEKDFELLVSLNVFNEGIMNQAVYSFKRYEDASLIYTGISKHNETEVGLFSTSIPKEAYDEMASSGLN